jgi:hypothetical protein
MEQGNSSRYFSSLNMAAAADDIPGLVEKCSDHGVLGRSLSFLSLPECIQAASVSRAFQRAVLGALHESESLDTRHFGSRETASSVCDFIAYALPWPRLSRLTVNLAVDAGDSYTKVITGLQPKQLKQVELTGLCRRSIMVESLALRCEGIETLDLQLRGHRGHAKLIAPLLERCHSLVELIATDCAFSDSLLIRALARGQLRDAPEFTITPPVVGGQSSSSLSGAAAPAVAEFQLRGSVDGSRRRHEAAKAAIAEATNRAEASPAASASAEATATAGTCAEAAAAASASDDVTASSPPALRGGPLKRLVLGKCLHLDAVGVTAIAEACPVLEELSVQGAPGIQEAAAEALSRGRCAGSLTKLCMPATRIGDAGVSMLAASCHNLTTLDFSAVRGVTDAGLRAIADSSCASKLEIVGLCGFGPGVTPDGMMAVVAALPRAKRMDLRSNRFSVTDAVISTLVSTAKDLEVLLLRGCGSVTNAGLEAIASSRCATATLRHIDLEFCIGITDPGVVALAEGCTKLQCISLRALVMTHVCLDTIRALWSSNPSLTELHLGQSGDLAVLQRFAAELVADRPGTVVAW